MAEVDDRWFKQVDGSKVKTARHGIGKRWRARWRDAEGRQREKSFDRKVDADRLAATVEADLIRRTYIDPDHGKVTVKAYAEAWRASQVHRAGTRAMVETHFNKHLYPVLGAMQIGAVKPSHIQSWVRGMESGRDGRAALMPGTVQNVYRYTGAIFKAAVADRIIAHSPFVGIGRTRPTKARVTPPTIEQIQALRAGMPEQYRALVAIGAGAGLRQGEAFGVELDCIDLEARELTVRQQVISLPGAVYLGPPKTAKSARTIPLADAVCAELAEHIKRFPPKPVRVDDRTNHARPVQRDALLLFVGPLGRPLIRQNWDARAWRPARDAAKLPTSFTFHGLRHFFASALIRYGESVKTVQEMLGHSSAMETLNTYSHIWPDNQDRTRAAIDDAMFRHVGQMWAEGIS